MAAFRRESQLVDDDDESGASPQRPLPLHEVAIEMVPTQFRDAKDLPKALTVKAEAIFVQGLSLHGARPATPLTRLPAHRPPAHPPPPPPPHDRTP